MRRCRRLIVLSVLSLLNTSCAVSGQAKQSYQTSAGELRLTTVARGLEHPWGLAFLPGGGMLVTERPGRMRIVSAEGRLSDPLEGVPRVQAGGQGGLLGVALDPGFEENRRIYFSYAEPGEDGAGTAVARARLGEGRLEDVSVIFRQQPIVDGSNHLAGGWCSGGTALSLSPSASETRATGPRNSTSTWAKSCVSSRMAPYHGTTRSSAGPPRCPEIWSYGHRNIQGATLHPETGTLWTVEYGAQGGDEVNIPRPGRNYGWPVITYGVNYGGGKIGEGTRKAGMEQPVHYWDPSIAPSGMVFYSGDRYPGWQGDLLSAR